MEIVFRKFHYDTEDNKDMKALQAVLDRIDIEERVKVKREAALLKKQAHASTN